LSFSKELERILEGLFILKPPSEKTINDPGSKSFVPMFIEDIIINPL
jgi:hypothetical protein